MLCTLKKIYSVYYSNYIIAGKRVRPRTFAVNILESRYLHQNKIVLKIKLKESKIVNEQGV